MTDRRPALLVIAKAPVAGHAKTRLSPPCNADEASVIALASLEDTLQAVLETPASDRVLVLDGDPGDWIPEGIRIIPQRGDGLDQRLAGAFEDSPTPALLIGMDTPQVTTSDLSEALDAMSDGSAVIGQAEDGGFWAIGLHAPDRQLLEGVPMSTDSTAQAQRARLANAGLTVHELPTLRDVDTFEDARQVADEAPDSRFALAVESVSETHAPRATWKRTAIALLGWIGVFLVAWQWGNLINGSRGRPDDMLVQAPPFTGHYRFGLVLGIIAPVLIGGLFVIVGPWIARRISWRTLLWVAFLASLTWILALVVADPIKHLSSPVRHQTDYMRGIPFIGDDLSTYLRTFTEQIGAYPSHVRSHPPGVVSTLWGLRQIGLGAAEVAAGLFILVGASAVPAIMIATRDVAGEKAGRAIAPFLVLAPAAIWIGTSADAMFAGVGAWTVALLVLATSPTRSRRHRRVLAVAGGIGIGVSMFMSYGLPLVVVIPIVVAWRRRTLTPLPLAIVPVAVITAAWAAAGFWWLDGLGATRIQYANGISQDRPYSYFLVANIAALSVGLGPAVVVGLSRLRGRAWWLVGGAILAVALADISGMSKAEVERIWLPFAVWLFIATVPLARARWSGRGWMGLQVALALALTVGVESGW